MFGMYERSQIRIQHCGSCAGFTVFSHVCKGPASSPGFEPAPILEFDLCNGIDTALGVVSGLHCACSKTIEVCCVFNVRPYCTRLTEVVGNQDR